MRHQISRWRRGRRPPRDSSGSCSPIIVAPRMRAGEHIAPALYPVSPAVPVTPTSLRGESGKPGTRPVPGLLYSDTISPDARPVPSRNLPPLLGALRLLPGRRKPSPLPVRPEPVPRTLWMWPGGATRYRCAAAFGLHPTSSPNSVSLWGQKDPGGKGGWGGPDN